MIFHRIAAAAAAAGAAALAVLVASCGGGSGGAGLETGKLRVSLTDAPVCGYDEVNVTVEKVRVHKSATAADGDAGWSEVVLNPARRINLATLTNGVLTDLGETLLPAGTYTQMRLVLAQNSGTTPPANSVVPTGGSEMPLDTPSAQQSGLKMKVNFDVPAGEVLDVTLDFDACKSVVKRGNSGRYNLKPVVAVIPRLAPTGHGVIGYVGLAIAYPHATQVSLQKDGVPVKSTFADGNGRFFLYPVPTDLGYDLVVTAEGRVTAVMTGVPVDTTDYTHVSTAGSPILPAEQSAGTAVASGVVTVGGSAVNTGGAVRAVQSLTGGPSVEVGYAAADADTGAYSMTLPLDKPVKVAYAPGATSFTFSGADADAGKYSLEASVPGSTLPPLPVTLTGDLTTNFTFP